jgi:hypothetical protein
MEPANLNPSTPDDARLEALLRQDRTPLPDDGFSQRVLALLPPRQRRRADWRRLCLYAAGAVAGLVIAYPHNHQLSPLTAFTVSLSHALAPLSHSWAGLWLGLVALAIVYAFSTGDAEESWF